MFTIVLNSMALDVSRRWYDRQSKISLNAKYTQRHARTQKHSFALTREWLEWYDQASFCSVIHAHHGKKGIWAICNHNHCQLVSIVDVFFGSVCWWLGAVAMNHSTIHVLFAIETMAIAIWRHLFLCHYQPVNTHTEAHSHTHMRSSTKQMELKKYDIVENI